MLTALLLALAGFLAWIVSTLAAGGGALLLIPVVTFLIGVQAVAPVVTLTTMIGEPARIYLFRKHINWRIVRWYLPGAITGAIIGGWLFATVEAEWLQLIVGLFLLSTVLQYRLGKKERSFPVNLRAFLPLGLGVSVVSAMIGTMGPVLNPFYLNYGVDKEAMIATKSVNSFVMHIAKISTYTAFGVMTGTLLLYGLAAGAGAAAANWLGKRMLEHLSSERFRQIVIVVMVVSGLTILWDFFTGG
jgi:uncharacterized protein